MKVFLASVMLLTVATAAPAQEGGTVVDAVAGCRDVKPDPERLACYDRTAEALAAARQKNGLVVLDRKEVREKRRSLFGLTLPDINLFGRDEAKEPEIQEITSTIADVTRSGRDRYVVRLADGSIWRTTEPTKFDPEKGDQVIVQRAALGSFRASFAKQFPVRVERIR